MPLSAVFLGIEKRRAVNSSYSYMTAFDVRAFAGVVALAVPRAISSSVAVFIAFSVVAAAVDVAPVWYRSGRRGRLNQDEPPLSREHDRAFDQVDHDIDYLRGRVSFGRSNADEL